MGQLRVANSAVSAMANSEDRQLRVANSEWNNSEWLTQPSQQRPNSEEGQLRVANSEWDNSEWLTQPSQRRHNSDEGQLKVGTIQSEDPSAA